MGKRDDATRGPDGDAQRGDAEAALRRLLAVEDTRPSGLRATLQELALRPDEVGAAARRVLRAP